MTTRFPSEPDPLSVASSDALPPVDSIRFTEPALDRVDDPARHHKALDVSVLDADHNHDDHAPLRDRDDTDDPMERDNDPNGDRPDRHALADHTDDAAKPDQTDSRHPVIDQHPSHPTDKQVHAIAPPQDPTHVTLALPGDETPDQTQPDETATAEHDHHPSDLNEHLHIHAGSSSHLAVLMPPHAQSLTGPPAIHPPTPPQPVKKKRRTYNTEEERRKARILKNRRTAEESRQRRMKKMKDLEDYAETAAIREKKLQEETRLVKRQLAAMRDSMDEVVAQKEAEIATKDAEIERLRDELRTR
ncbi:unnamed protein product [Chondrus crispus]|uniref:BZIP domain-containing protein n=1 Tax=Chondrus crispus TaxID=2769 RepID=R7QL80_CHOCR|nr:unnamed protein product [Chondrus crispus]CDF38844.1 unnamed protein product [Chondrus crispus]|eukprot:XP_005718749.1 unnamed protein product [Chondrus crispus]